MNTRFNLLLSMIILLSGIAVQGQSTFFTRLQSDPPERIILYCQWDSLLAFKTDREWEATLNEERGDSITKWRAELSGRGKYRLSNCSFPPLEINLKKSELRSRGMIEFDKFKLVTHCDNESKDVSNIYEELLVYSLYNLLTPESYRVREVRIDYLYPDGKQFRKNTIGLILEPTAELISRLGGRELETYGVPGDSLDGDSYCRNALFQFMIGNFDWDLAMQRNVKMIGAPGHYHVVPYDFDFSAIVSPAYARLPGDYDIKDFRDRVYKGELFLDRLPVAEREFIGKKNQLIGYVENYKDLSKTRRNEIEQYLELFFGFIENPNHVLTNGTVLRFSEK